MKLEDLEKYRESGYINIDKFLSENPEYDEEILREVRGSGNREKDWISLDDTSILVRTENLRDLGVNYTSFAELLTEEVAKQVDIPAAHYDLVTYKGEKGVLSQNIVSGDEVLINISEVLKQLNENINLDFIKFGDVLGGVKTLKSYEEDMTIEDVRKIQMDFLKIAAFDIFSMNTDRNGENFSLIYDNGKIRMAPIYDNEHSFGGGIDDETLNSINSNKKAARFYSDTLMPVLEADEDHFNQLVKYWEKCSPRESEKNMIPLNWQSSIIVLSDFLGSEELNDFLENCYKNIDLEKAFASVEDRIKIKVPEEYKECVKNIYNERKKYIDDVLLLDEEREYDEDDISLLEEENKDGKDDRDLLERD